jgi:ketosteroid isomerase-like protein
MKAQHPNAARVLETYEAVALGDKERIDALFSPDVVLHVPGRSPSGGSWRGSDSLTAPFRGLAELTKGTLHTEPIHAVADDHYGFVLHRHSSERDGRKLEVHFVVVYRFGADGRIEEAWEYPYDLYAFDAQYT